MLKLQTNRKGKDKNLRLGLLDTVIPKRGQSGSHLSKTHRDEPSRFSLLAISQLVTPVLSDYFFFGLVSILMSRDRGVEAILPSLNGYLAFLVENP